MIHYTKEYIGKLLDKYMDGTTTLEEEDALSHYFRGKDIPQEWEDYRQLFQEIEAMRPKTNRRWIGWGVAAAIVAGILYLAMPSVHQEDQTPLVAAADTTATQQSESGNRSTGAASDCWVAVVSAAATNGVWSSL